MNRVTHKMKEIHTRNISQLSHYWRVGEIWNLKMSGKITEFRFMCLFDR